MALTLDQLTDYSTVVVGPDGSPAGDLTGRVIRGRQVVAEHVIRSWTCPRAPSLGSMPWAPGQGVDVTALENSTADGTTLARWRARLASQAKRASGFVADCAVTVSFDAALRAFRIAALLTLTDGSTLPLDVIISQASGAILALVIGTATGVPRAQQGTKSSGVTATSSGISSAGTGRLN